MRARDYCSARGDVVLASMPALSRVVLTCIGGTPENSIWLLRDSRALCWLVGDAELVFNRLGQVPVGASLA